MKRAGRRWLSNTGGKALRLDDRRFVAAFGLIALGTQLVVAGLFRQGYELAGATDMVSSGLYGIGAALIVGGLAVWVLWKEEGGAQEEAELDSVGELGC